MAAVKQCDTCLFWVRWSHLPDDVADGVPSRGTCRRHAPAPSVHIQKKDVDGPPSNDNDWRFTIGLTCWPNSDSCDWCGEWKAKEAPKPSVSPEMEKLLAMRVCDVPELNSRAGRAIWLAMAAKQGMADKATDLGYPTVADLLDLSEYDLLCVRDCGVVTVRNIRKFLTSHGLALKGES